MVVIRCCFKKSTETSGEESMTKEANVGPDFNPWSDPEKLEELLKDLILMSKTENENENEKDEYEILNPMSCGPTNTASVVSGAKRLGVTTHQYYCSRQKFLSSYNLKSKESFRNKTVKWFKNKLYLPSLS